MAISDNVLLSNENNNEDIKPPLFKLEWPVYTRYKFMLLDDYVKQLPESTQEAFKYGAGRYIKTAPEFNSDAANLKDLIVVVPEGPIKHFYNPCKMGVKLFESFAYLGSDMKKIQSWLDKYGLPFSTAAYSGKRDSSEYEGGGYHFDQIFGLNITIEGMIERDLRHYVMMNETLLKLIEESIKLLEDLYSIRGSKNKRKRRQKLDYVIVRKTKSELSMLSQNFYSRLNDYLSGASPMLALPSSRNPGDYVRSWRVNNLWAAMIVLFYESIINNNPVRRCRFCNKIIDATHGNLMFCPDDYYVKYKKKSEHKHSSCENRYQQKKRRDKLKKKREKVEMKKKEKIETSLKEIDAAKQRVEDAKKKAERATD